MSEMITFPTVDQGGFKNSRKDRWWSMPLLQASVLSFFIVYTVWAIIIEKLEYSKVQGTNYISPFFSPEVELDFWPSYLSPAFILIWIPLGFRTTCYYARKVYYRAFFADPPACAVSELRKVNHKYKGENKLPFIISNLHRYFFYLAFVLAIVHIYDFLKAMFFENGIGFGIGTLLLGADAFFLFLYVASCHSGKHFVGGKIDRFPSKNLQYKTWKFVKKLNTHHHAYFWWSLITVLLADVYIRLLSHGIIKEWIVIIYGY